MSPLEVPCISLSSWLASDTEVDRDEIAKVWHESFRSLGLLYLTDHGLEELYLRLSRDWLQFCACEQVWNRVK